MFVAAPARCLSSLCEMLECRQIGNGSRIPVHVGWYSPDQVLRAWERLLLLIQKPVDVHGNNHNLEFPGEQLQGTSDSFQCSAVPMKLG